MTELGAVVGRLTQIFHDLFGDDTIQLRPEMSATDVKGWDSMKHISLMVAIEDEFGISFTTAEIEDLTNVGDLMRVIDRKLV